MREHMGLYRGKRIDNGEWVEGCLQIYAGIVSILYATEWYRVDPDTVGECTGLMDKNGKLIFEEDILRLNAEERELEEDGFGVIHFGRFKDTDAMSDYDHLGWYITITSIPYEATTVFVLEELGLAFEIIGNIYDDPELLKDGDANG